jgi:hypothetical protein
MQTLPKFCIFRTFLNWNVDFYIHLQA